MGAGSVHGLGQSEPHRLHRVDPRLLLRLLWLECRKDICVDMCVDMYVDMCVDMCADICVDMCMRITKCTTDMRTDKCRQTHMDMCRESQCTGVSTCVDPPHLAWWLLWHTLLGLITPQNTTALAIHQRKDIAH